jgi:hypothetical protein
MAYLGGLLAAIVWAVAVAFAELDSGWAVWGCGVLVGLATRVLARGRAPAFAPLAAALFTALAVVSGKVCVAVQDVEARRAAATGDNLVLTDELAMSTIANEFVAILEEAGEPVDWPAGVDPATAQSQFDYPLDVWAATEIRWSEMSTEEREAFRDERRREREAEIEAEFAGVRGEAVRDSFGGARLAFVALAIVTALGLARSGKPRDEPHGAA